MTTPNNDELFGRYASIEMKRHGVPNEHYQHKVIGRFRSNTWVEVPIQSPASPIVHDHSEDVINVICCGVAEETVYRVRLSDVKLTSITSHDQQLLWEILESVRSKVVTYKDKSEWHLVESLWMDFEGRVKSVFEGRK